MQAIVRRFFGQNVSFLPWAADLIEGLKSPKKAAACEGRSKAEQTEYPNV
ncbi:hypothetical protein [Deinococcus xinjiangensis]